MADSQRGDPMPRFLRVVLIALSLALGGPLAPSAQTSTTACPSNPAPGSTVNGNLVVPAGLSCVLFNVIVTGNVTVEADAAISLINSTINGGLIATNSNGVTTPAGRSTIKGSLTISGGSSSRLHDPQGNRAVN